MRVLSYALVVSFAVAAMAAPIARADAADDTFLSAVAGQGVVRERGDLIATGHIVCDALTQPGLVPPQLQVMSAIHVMPDQAAFVVNAATSAYCPQYM
jgi:Protein of unknown function (DUF732)